eukprot:1176186-Prorocentrum_minimum.AAC.3
MRLFPLPSLDWVIQWGYSLPAHSIGSYNGNITSPLTRLGHKMRNNLPPPLARRARRRQVHRAQ